VRLNGRWLAVFLGLIVSACGDERPPAAPTVVPADLVRVDIDGPTQHEIGTPGATLQLRAVATLADGTRPDVTSEAAWSVTDGRVLAVSPRGLVTGLADGATIVTATYRERAGATNVRVGPAGGRPFAITGVVVDAEAGTPVVEAEIRQGSSENDALLARTDGNGFFSLGERTGFFSFRASQFGYEDTMVTLAGLVEPTHLDIRLRPNPGLFIERRETGAVTHVDGRTESDVSLRLTTRTGGVFDAIVRGYPCGSGDALALFAESGAHRVVGQRASCEGARVRFVVPEPQVRLTIRAYQPIRWELTFREPR
jgi:hypothetical protein